MTKDQNSGTKLGVLLLAKRFPPMAGGVAQYSIQVGRAYSRRGINVVAVTQASVARGWTLDEEEASLRVMNIGPGPQPVAFIKFLTATIRLLRTERFGLVHATTWRMALVARVLAPRIPLVVTVHGREVLNFPSVMGPFLRNVLRRATLVLAVSNASMELARSALHPRYPVGQWFVRYNGLSYPSEAQTVSPRAEERPKVEILSLCRLVPRKNVAGALRAIASVRQQTNIPIRFTIAGTGPDRASLEALSMELGLIDVVEFLGFVDDSVVPTLYSRSDIFVHPHTHEGEGNDFEGFGITIADAMSFACAVVVGNAGGPAELVIDGVDGRLVDGLSAASLSEAIGELVGDAIYRRQLGTAAKRSSLSRFSWDKHIDPAVEILRHDCVS